MRKPTAETKGKMVDVLLKRGAVVKLDGKLYPPAGRAD